MIVIAFKVNIDAIAFLKCCVNNAETGYSRNRK